MAYNDWKLGDSIGEGGQAFVFIATRTGDQNQYALKRFKNPKREERSKSEILNMKNIRSLGIRVPEIIESGIFKEGKPYFVTKYYSNKSLEYEINQGYKNINRIEFAKKLCEEISKMNKAGFVHRDLKPANILLDDNWNPVIADFGLAKSTDEVTGYTKSGEPIGSIHYMHPSAFDAKNIDNLLYSGFDGYSFGKMLHQLLSGNQLYGFNLPGNSDEYLTTLSDPYVRNKMYRGLKILLGNDLEGIVNYWKSFPAEFDKLLSEPFESRDLDKETAEKLKRTYIERSASDSKVKEKKSGSLDKINEEVLALVKNCKALKYLDDLMNEIEENERVMIQEKANLREVLEGVGVKSNYGIEPLRQYGRKQSLVNSEILITLPKTKSKIGISIINNAPNTIILLTKIESRGTWIDVEEKSIEKVLVNERSRIEESYLLDIEKYIINKIQE